MQLVYKGRHQDGVLVGDHHPVLCEPGVPVDFDVEVARVLLESGEFQKVKEPAAPSAESKPDTPAAKEQ